MLEVYDPPASLDRSANDRTLNTTPATSPAEQLGDHPADLHPDLVDALLALPVGIEIRYTTTPTYTDPCGACPEAAPEPDHPVQDAQAVVSHQHVGETAVYREPVCSEHLGDVVTYERLRGLPTTVWVEVPR